MLLRLRAIAWALAVSIDQLAHIILAAPKYLILGGPVPDPDETISSKVGRMAVRGRRWALIAERVIDWLFERLGEAPGHCRRNIGR
ncbi:hypothetical protein SAMN06295912_108109 [Sphingomonas laterariae]|uniref:Uncharacterized protein n=1 Tax=Edaphosphingomonas laterariae TaxID=861865 RepID=A0A239F851_9SPHN|nr:hypothetical protein [Sphingomonas laterariae]SNS52995.1 hypothetical protein SAMN06295912_108109 [Sphingomonas laterariae]